jgi:diguanylate cyclase (GGDEF)-like protein
MPFQPPPLPRARAAFAAAGVTLLVGAAAVSGPALAKKGGQPAGGNGPGAAAMPPGQAKHAAAPAGAAPAGASAPKGKAPKAKGHKAKPQRGAGVAASAPAPSAPSPVPAAPVSAPVSAIARATTPSSAARRRPNAPHVGRSPAAPVVLGVQRSGRTPSRANAAAVAAARRSPSARLFTPPPLRDVAAVPAVTRLVQVIPRFVWLILAGLVTLAALLAAALAIYARRLRRTAERAAAFAGLAATDPLTGLLNRRGFEASLGVELSRARRYGGALALVFGDLRALKSINDVHGHEAGDQALRSVGEILRSQVRDGDACGRMGGDEYAVVLVNQGAAGAQAFCDRVRDRLSATSGPHGGDLDLTMGVALFPRDGDSPDLLLTAADRDLYAQRGIAVG